MDISEHLKKPHLSASSINQYLDCGLSYKFARIDRLEPEFFPDTMLFGSTIHQVLENYYLNKQAGIHPSLKDLQNCFEKLWTLKTNQLENVHYSQNKDQHSYLVEGKELLSAWYEKQPEQNYRILGVEEEFVFYVPGIEIPIVGYIDLLEEDETGIIIVTDFKTTARSYGREEIDTNMQLLMYQLFLKSSAYKDREILLRLDCLIKTKTPKFESYYTTRSQEDEKRLIRKVQQVWDGIQKEVYLPANTGWKCKGCQYQNTCQKWFLES